MSNFTEISRLSRLTSILLALQTGRKHTARKLAEKYAVSMRTIYRDIKALTDAGVPIYADEDKGYQIVDGYALPPIMFTEEEANSLITAEKLIARSRDQSLISAHEKAIEKIKAVLQYNKKSNVNMLSDRIGNFSNLGRYTTSSNLLGMQAAITKGEVLNIKYTSLSKQEATSRLVEPQAIYHTRGNWVLIAWCRMRESYREFRLDKMSSYILTGEKIKDRNFDLTKYFHEVRERNQSGPDIGLSLPGSSFASINQKTNNMSKTTLDSFYLVGISKKTKNPDGQAARDIPALWQRFMQERVSAQIANKVGTEILCAYTEYEGDHNQPYTAIVGHKVSDISNVPAGMKIIEIPGGNYQKVVAKGDLTGAAVYDAWLDIWKENFDRTYAVDFEVYGDRALNIKDGEADIFVGVKS